MQTEAEFRAFFTKDLSDMANHRGESTIFAVDYENSSDVNDIERIFGLRDMKVEENLVPPILTDEQAK